MTANPNVYSTANPMATCSIQYRFWCDSIRCSPTSTCCEYLLLRTWVLRYTALMSSHYRRHPAAAPRDNITQTAWLTQFMRVVSRSRPYPVLSRAFPSAPLKSAIYRVTSLSNFSTFTHQLKQATGAECARAASLRYCADGVIGCVERDL